MNLKENYERFFGEMSNDLKPKQVIKLDESQRRRFNVIANELAKRYPRAPITLHEGYVWFAGKKIEPVTDFLNRSAIANHEKVRSFASSQSKRLI